MADQGFVVNDLGGASGVEASVGTSYSTSKYALLHEDSGIDARSKAMPQSCYLSHLELSLTTAGGSPTTVSCFLTWDSAGNDALTAEASAVALHAGVTIAGLQSTSIALDVWVNAPTDQTTDGKVYLWLKVDAGTVDITRARLNWVSRHD